MKPLTLSLLISLLAYTAQAQLDSVRHFVNSYRATALNYNASYYENDYLPTYGLNYGRMLSPKVAVGGGLWGGYQWNEEFDYNDSVYYNYDLSEFGVNVFARRFFTLTPKLLLVGETTLGVGWTREKSQYPQRQATKNDSYHFGLDFGGGLQYMATKRIGIEGTVDNLGATYSSDFDGKSYEFELNFGFNTLIYSLGINYYFN